MESNSIVLSAVKAVTSKANNLSRTQKVISISAALVATLTYVLFKKTTTPPKRLKHIPHVDYVKMMMALLTGKPMMDINKTCIDPVIAKSSIGLYLRPSRKVWNIYVTEPELAKIVYNKNDLFPKLDLTQFSAGTYMGKFSARSNNLFFSTGDEWKRQRRIANPAFHRAMPISLFGLYAEKLFACISKSHTTNGSVVDLSGYVTDFTLDIIGDAGFGKYHHDFRFNSLQDSTSEYVTRYEKVVEALMDPLFYLFPALDKDYLWLFPKRQEIHKELGVFLDMVQEIIVKKRQTLTEQNRLKELAVSNGEAVDEVEKSANDKDILTLLIESADEEENKDISEISDDMLLSNMCVLFTAGHDTTTAALLFCIYELAVNQSIQEKARSEIISILGDEKSDVLPIAEQLVKMEYLNAIIKETLRLHSPVAVSSPRLAMEDCMLGSTLIPKGSTVVIDAISIHRNPKYWKYPDVFNPDRFVAGGEAETHAGSGLTYVPFGGGSRHCIGRNFAINEQKVMLSMFLRKYTWTLSEDSMHKNGLVTKGIFLLNTPEMKVDLTSRY
ncbi:Nitrogen permease regulator 3 [Mucor velutinosus]|uniref:Nitrogen permease regulator 3 n=1 Tax=Mucor velutinosus TaxID=708070 RepID=A0AAN7DRU1_9FUNG|nr:Nitrogen permease regulator 3 [Mucor velutinosus]